MNYLKDLEYLKGKLEKANITYQTKPIEDIETALKRLKELEEEKQSFDRVIENKLKALEVIEEKSVNVYAFQHSGDLETYNDMVDSEDRKLNAKEYDLLKEVLL